MNHSKEIKYELDEKGCYNCISHRINTSGYPVFSTDKKSWIMNRYIYTINFGEIPKGLIVRHKCDNRKCINPEHLEVGTHKDNAQDRENRNRSWSKKGMKHPRAILTEDQIINIFLSKDRQSDSARKYNITRQAVNRIKKGINWTQITKKLKIMNEGFINYNTANFDPNSLANQTSTVIMFGVAVDVSPSIQDYVDEMNTASREVFMQELKNCHRKDDIVIKGVFFNETVTHKSGFMPILNLPDEYLDTAPSGGGTALYQAVLDILEHAKKYREDLEDQGIEVRTSLFIITDGQDNSSHSSVLPKIRAIVDQLKKNEAWASSFTINMLGVGVRSYFEHACREMGLDPDKCLVAVGTSAGEIRKHMGVISQSVSSSSGQAATVNF